MYCSTCGALIPAGRDACGTCGARVVRAGITPVPERPGAVAATFAVCPRCGYRGDGLPYFSRGSHIAGLVGLTLFTSWGMGAGGLIYYLLRHDHRVCPRCGRSWGQYGERALVDTAAPGNVSTLVGKEGGSKRGWSILLFLLAAVLTIGGLLGSAFQPVMLGAAAAAGGLLLLRASDRDRAARRAALLSALQLPVLQLAAGHGGRLTVTEAAAELGWPMRRAEKVLHSLDDGLRVSSEVTDEGVIVYEFRELMRPRN